jgi:hypothetical protein
MGDDLPDPAVEVNEAERGVVTEGDLDLAI